MPDVNQQWAEFQKYYSVTEESPIPDVEALIEDTSSAAQEEVSPGISSKRPVRSRRIWRAALTAAALAVCILGCMVAAQAAGVDVFGAMARWTESTFSLGTVRSQGAKEVPSEGSALVEIITPTVLESSSLQEVLDANEVTEVIAPTWIPKGYTLDLVKVDPEWFLVYAEYTDGTDTLQISIMSYTNEPSWQIEKTDTPPETFEIGGITFYLIENTKNYTVAWCTDHYEYYIYGALNQKENLKKMVYSMYLGTDQTDGAGNEMPDNSDNNRSIGGQAKDSAHEYSSLQEALDAYGVTEVTAPTWIPEGYEFDRVDVLYIDDPEQLIIVATYYLNDGNPLHISIQSYTDEPNRQVEKTDTPPETFEAEGIMFYLVENTANYTVAWVTNHYECYIEGAKGMEAETLKDMVYSMFD